MNNWKKEWDGEAFFSGKNSNSEGIAILFKKDFPYKFEAYTELIEGRLVALNIKCNDDDLFLINIYGSNKD